MELLDLEKAKSPNLNKERIVETFLEMQKETPRTFVEGRRLHDALKEKYPDEFGKLSSQRRSTEIKNALRPIAWYRRGGDYFVITDELLEEAKGEGITKEEIEQQLTEAGFKPPYSNNK